MSLARVYSRAQVGIDAPLVSVEVHLSNGLPGLSIVGLPEAAVRESKDRVRAAILNSRFEFPARRITINLAPADLPKEGGRFDLPIALGILAASGQLPANSLNTHEFIGELGLSGELRPVRGALPVAIQTAHAGRSLILPRANAAEACLVKAARILAADHLLDISAHLCGQQLLVESVLELDPELSEPGNIDLSDVKGQHRAKRALEVAAAGGHNMLMIGSPGTGKTMLASRLASILPPMDDTEAAETAAISSISDAGFTHSQWKKRPFRSPHHTASGVALVGGGSYPRPGEVSLAHNGVLFLDELTEFDRHVLEVLREPIETGRITISRAARQAEFPARFQLIAAMNPCPRGCDIDEYGQCSCSSEVKRRYRNRVSAPLLDRIDLHIDVPRVPREMLHTNTRQAETSREVRARVILARKFMYERQAKINAGLSNREVETWCRLSAADQTLLDTAMEKFRLSARAYHRILKVARTIADIESSPDIQKPHISEAISYRSLDRLTANS